MYCRSQPSSPWSSSKERRLRDFHPRLGLLRGLGRPALAHHALNVVLHFPQYSLPLLVTAMLSATMNAYFYVAWMIASVAYLGPTALTTVLYAVGVRDRSLLATRARFTLSLAFAGGFFVNAVLLIGGDQILGVFGDAYPAQAGATLRIVALGVFPVIVREHYVALCRISGRTSRAAALIAAAGVFELAMAAAGARIAGLPGLSLGWLAALGIQAAFMGWPVAQMADLVRTSSHRGAPVARGLPLSEAERATGP